MELFKKMPGAFPEDLPKSQLEQPVSDERKRRLAIKRVQRPTR